MKWWRNYFKTTCKGNETSESLYFYRLLPIILVLYSVQISILVYLRYIPVCYTFEDKLHRERRGSRPWKESEPSDGTSSPSPIEMERREETRWRRR